MASATRQQDMPPEGGYKRILFARNPARSYFNGYQCIAAYLGITAAGLGVYYLTHREIERETVEMRSARLAILPLLAAERDREYLKQLRRNRDEEAQLMANVPGWKVGTWYGEPIYKTKEADAFVEPSIKEFYGHTEFSNLARRAHLKLWT